MGRFTWALPPVLACLALCLRGAVADTTGTNVAGYTFGSDVKGRRGSCRDMHAAVATAAAAAAATAG